MNEASILLNWTPKLDRLRAASTTDRSVLPDLGSALFKVSKELCDVDSLHKAFEHLKEAGRVYSRLAESDPAYFSPLCAACRLTFFVQIASQSPLKNVEPIIDTYAELSTLLIELYDDDCGEAPVAYLENSMPIFNALLMFVKDTKEIWSKRWASKRWDAAADKIATAQVLVADRYGLNLRAMFEQSLDQSPLSWPQVKS